MYCRRALTALWISFFSHYNIHLSSCKSWHGSCFDNYFGTTGLDRPKEISISGVLSKPRANEMRLFVLSEKMILFCCCFLLFLVIFYSHTVLVRGCECLTELLLLKLLSANISIRLENVFQLFPHVLSKEKKIRSLTIDAATAAVFMIFTTSLKVSSRTWLYYLFCDKWEYCCALTACE